MLHVAPNYSPKYNKIKNKKYHTVGTILKSIIKTVGRCKINTHTTQTHDRSLSWLGTGTLIKVAGLS